MKVQLIGWTELTPPENVDWSPDYDSGPGTNLVEFAGRACYQGWDRPNLKTATNAGYIHHILRVGHFSVLEHASATFYVEGVSRSLTHELIRHRHLSFSQLSQRYVDGSDTEFIAPPVIAGDPELLNHFTEIVEQSRVGYNGLVETLTEKFPEAKRKEIRQAARSVLPNATETKIVVTGNYRAWRHFIDLRATEGADVEIRALSIAVLRELQGIARVAFCDYSISDLEDGSQIAGSDLGEKS